MNRNCFDIQHPGGDAKRFKLLLLFIIIIIIYLLFINCIGLISNIVNMYK